MAQTLQEKSERDRLSFVFQQWTAVNTTNSRVAIPDQTFYACENLQPIGFANLHTVPALSAVLHDYGADPVYWDQAVNISNTDYFIVATTNGKLFAYNVGSATVTQINGAFTLSGAGTRITQWENSAALIIDATGYYAWTGSGNITQITVTGAPSSGNDIAVYADRVWIVQGRTLFFSIADGYGASAGDWLAANGSGFVILTDVALRSNVTRLLAVNGYLYIIGSTSVNAISDVYIPSGASPPTPVFTNLNLQGIIGTDQPGGVFVYGRAIMIANRFGVYALLGVSATKISGVDPNSPYGSGIDGTWQFINFGQPLSGGSVIVNNILCAAFLIQRANDPVFGSNTVVMMFQDGKWWNANYGALTRITGGFASNAPALYGYIGNKFYQAFQNTALGAAALLMTPLWAFGDPITSKQFIRVGFQLSISVLSGTFTLNVDTTTQSIPVTSLQSVSQVAWQNNTPVIVQWQNNFSQIVTWFSGNYALYAGPSPAGYDKYVGLTFKSTGSVYELNAMLIDYKWGPRW